MYKVLKLKPDHWQAMRQHVSSQAPLEACGLLAGKGDVVESGPDIVSPTDVAEVAYEVVQVTWSRKRRIWNARGF